MVCQRSGLATSKSVLVDSDQGADRARLAAYTTGGALPRSAGACAPHPAEAASIARESRTWLRGRDPGHRCRSSIISARSSCNARASGGRSTPATMARQWSPAGPGHRLDSPILGERWEVHQPPAYRSAGDDLGDGARSKQGLGQLLRPFARDADDERHR